ncbi:hypothetical protein CK203_089855 [Vitis vinifera]|uniref:Uncharacterized protein n=1 Tax=Vitis vinifera TaxID=29760 RepID=A0A438FK48_VITVI|nr:hypothetical protein CK203_089855 [Vitis vinifera]
MVETSRDWSEKLPFALWAYRTSFRTSTGATPYSLVYGMEAMLPVEIEMGSLRVALEQQIPEADWAQARFDQLNLLDERRLRAADHVRAYQRKMARAFKKRVKPRPLHRELTPEGAAWLMDLDGNRFSEPTNVDQLKSFLSFLSPYHLGLRYVPCLKTTLRPWDQMSSSAASTWTGLIQLCSDYQDQVHGSSRTCATSLTGCSSRRGHDRLLTEPLRSTPAVRTSRHLDSIMPLHWEGHISVRMRFTDHEGVACLALFGEISPLVYMIIHGYEIHAGSMFDLILSGYSEEPLLSHSARFIPFDIVGWGYVECLDPHVIISVRLAFRAAVHSRFTIFRVIMSHFSVRCSEPLLSLTFRVITITFSFGVQSHHHYFSQFRRSESSVFRSTFRVPSSVSAFRVVITSQFDVQSHHHHFSVSAFKAIVGFQIDIQSRILGFSVQSRYHFSV